MRDPFNAPVDLIEADRRVGNELTRTNVTLSARDYALQNGDAKPFVPSSDTLVRSSIPVGKLTFLLSDHIQFFLLLRN
jgi:hypothetical protein